MHLLLFNIVDQIRSLGWGGAFELLRNGIVLGSLYSLIALGYTMIYGILKLLNFAHGDIYMIGAFIGYGIMTSFHGPMNLSIPIALLLLLMLLGAMTGSAGSPLSRLAALAHRSR